MQKQWWKEAVFYQVYPRSFYDANGDGIGDIQGLIEKLDYLEDLGIDVIWLSPIYASPNDDNGYDISDYQRIQSDFGTMADFDRLLDEVHGRGMRLIMDLVLNHTSDEHAWFIESRSSKDNPYRDYYIWHSDPGQGRLPNNWASIFSGSVWEWDPTTEEYYMHVFSKKQPDLNWENPEVRHALYDTVNWWLDKGIDGFRVDAISHIKKQAGYPDLPNPEGLDYVPSFDAHMNQAGIGDFLKEMREATFDHYDVVTVAEANGVHADEAEAWAGSRDGYFDMIFQFDHVALWSQEGDLDFVRFKRLLSDWQNALDGRGWNALFVENHDLVRTVSFLGNDGNLRKTSAKAIAMMYFFMQGSPFIYQGQELGMTNVKYPRLEDYDDIQSVNKAKEMLAQGQSEDVAMAYMWRHSRDNSRTPMQWEAKSQAGFSQGSPWLAVNPNYAEINVAESQKDPESVLNFYKAMIHLRKEIEDLVYGSYHLILADHPAIFSYLRRGDQADYLIVVNMMEGHEAFDLADYALKDCLLANYADEIRSRSQLSLRPYEARLYRLA